MKLVSLFTRFILLMTHYLKTGRCSLFYSLLLLLMSHNYRALMFSFVLVMVIYFCYSYILLLLFYFVELEPMVNNPSDEGIILLLLASFLYPL